MSRLLHAAARGARIGWYLEGEFHPALSLPYLQSNPDLHEIHPDDAHLQYGPISTALRDVALTNDCDGADIPYIEVTLLSEEGHFNSTEEQRCVFLLILAEALADSGL
jgi:hypothetical protein